VGLIGEWLPCAPFSGCRALKMSLKKTVQSCNLYSCKYRDAAMSPHLSKAPNIPAKSGQCFLGPGPSEKRYNL
jgi:hypothetical protein